MQDRACVRRCIAAVAFNALSVEVPQVFGERCERLTFKFATETDHDAKVWTFVVFVTVEAFEQSIHSKFRLETYAARAEVLELLFEGDARLGKKA